MMGVPMSMALGNFVMLIFALEGEGLMYNCLDAFWSDLIMQGVYLTWMISALALGVILLPVFKPKWMELRLTTFVDFSAGIGFTS